MGQGRSVSEGNSNAPVAETTGACIQSISWLEVREIRDRITQTTAVIVVADTRSARTEGSREILRSTEARGIFQLRRSGDTGDSKPS